MPNQLTKTERRILDYIVSYLKQNTYQPSIREIGKRFGIKSTKTVSEHLHSLAEKGFIEREASRSRGVRIRGLDLAPDAVDVPVYGKVAAGDPVLLRDHVTAEYSVDRDLAGGSDNYFLRVVGDSMDGTGIFDGDLVLVEPVENSDVANGDIVAARLGGEGTVKHYYERDGEVVLEPANSDYAPILVREHDDFRLLGRVIGLFRRFDRDRSGNAS